MERRVEKLRGNKRGTGINKETTNETCVFCEAEMSHESMVVGTKVMWRGSFGRILVGNSGPFRKKNRIKNSLKQTRN